jgi:hypothetical protein
MKRLIVMIAGNEVKLNTTYFSILSRHTRNTFTGYMKRIKYTRKLSLGV